VKKMAQKMALVPIDFTNRQNIHTPTGPPMNQLTTLDEEMKSILDNRTLDPSVKLMKYYYTLNRYDTIRDNMSQSRIPPRMQQESTSNVDKTIIRELPVTETELIESQPKNFRNMTKVLLRYIKDNPDISWKPTGELVYKDNVIPQSNIYDLVGDLTRHRKTHSSPPGWKEITDALNEQNVPKAAIGNNRRWEYIMRARRGSPIQQPQVTPARRLNMTDNDEDEDESPLSVRRRILRSSGGASTSYNSSADSRRFSSARGSSSSGRRTNRRRRTGIPWSGFGR
jgi:hypothetical protein